jgi:hypothetical protein
VGGAGLGYNDPANGNDLQASTFEFVLRGRPALMTALADQQIDTHCLFQICGAAPQWARISVIMVVASWHDALAADQLPREIVGNWCVAIEQMLREQTYPYRRCKDSNWDIIVRWDGFDAQETSCELNTIKRQGAAWLASFGCSGAGLTWVEDDEIRIGKDGWTLAAKIKNVRRVGDPIRYCLGSNKC